MFIKTSEKVNRRYKHMITAFQKYLCSIQNADIGTLKLIYSQRAQFRFDPKYF